MASRVVIHAGFFKTGTTNLQSSLYAIRNTLKENKILYPVITSGNAGRVTGQHRAAWALKGRVWGWENAGGKTVPIKVWKNLAKQINKYPDTAVISSEFLSELNSDDIREMKKSLKTTDFKIVFTIRPLVKMLPSQYQQSLKYGMRLNYEEWLQRVLRGDENHLQWRTFWERHNHPDVISRWIENYGAENIVLIVADETNPDFIFNSFNDLLDLPQSTIKKLENSPLNRSLSWEEISLLLELNNRYDRSMGWQNYSIMIRDGYMKSLTDSPATDNDQKLLTPQWAVDQARQITDSNITKISNLGIEILGNLDSMLDAEIPTGVNQKLEKLDIDLAAKIMLTHTQEGLIKFFSAKVIADEFFKRMDSYTDNPLKLLVLKTLKKYLQK